MSDRTITEKSYVGLESPLLDRKARRVALEKIRGMWKGRTKEMIQENRKIRKEWDARVKKLGW